MISLEEMKRFKIREDKTIHDDESKKRLIDDDSAMNNKVCKSPHHKDSNHFNHLFSHRPGSTRLSQHFPNPSKQFSKNIFKKRINKII